VCEEKKSVKAEEVSSKRDNKQVMCMWQKSLHPKQPMMTKTKDEEAQTCKTKSPDDKQHNR
jgi:hypothetical protein